MKNISLIAVLTLSVTIAFGQIDKDQLSLDISKAESANTEQLKSFIWKRYSTATVSGAVKATLVNELSFGEDDSLHVTNIDATTTVRQKPGVRGRAQQNAAEKSMDYVEKALQMSIAYTYMSKGNLLDFFDKATVTEADGIITANGENVYVKGDKLTIALNAETKLFISKTFTTIMDGDPVEGKITYALFTSGVNHGDVTVIKLPAKDAVINAKNKDYTIRVK